MYQNGLEYCPNFFLPQKWSKTIDIFGNKICKAVRIFNQIFCVNIFEVFNRENHNNSEYFWNIFDDLKIQKTFFVIHVCDGKNKTFISPFSHAKNESKKHILNHFRQIFLRETKARSVYGATALNTANLDSGQIGGRKK